MILKIIGASILSLIVIIFLVGRYLAKGLEKAEEELHEPMYDNRYKKP